MNSQLLCHRIKIPTNLDAVLHRLTREMIYQQPKDVYEFAADFFDRLVQERDGSKSSQHPLSTVLYAVINNS